MTKEELSEKWRRNDNPRVRDAWLERVFFGAEIAWEKGRPYRVIVDADGRKRHEPVPRWTTNRALAARLAGGIGLRRRADPEETADHICLRALIRRMEIGAGLWGISANPNIFSRQDRQER